MKVTFVMPPAIKGKAPDRLFGCNYGIYFQPNIFVLYPAAMLEKAGYEVFVIDCPVEKINWKEFKKIIEKDDSNAYIFYTVFLAEKADKRATKLIRKIRRNIPIIFIGPEPTSRPEHFILADNFFVIRGETEYAIVELIKELEGNRKFKKILGLSWSKNGKIFHNKPRPLIDDLDKLPFPARHLIKKDLYFNPKLKGRPSTVMLTSRGCWARCIYCIPCSYMFAREIEYKRYFRRKPMVRVRSPKNIYKEFELLKRQCYKSVAIIDDNFMGLKGQEKRIIKLCKLIKPLKMEWGCLTRADQLQNEKLIKAMADAGCTYVDIGVESFDQKVLDYVKKDTKVSEIFDAIRLLKKYNVDPKINILFGVCPYETEESIKQTVKILKGLDLIWVNFGVAIPHPNTDFYKIIKKNKWFGTKSRDYVPVDPYRDATVNLPNLSSKDYKRLVRWAYRSYFLRPSYLWKKLKDIKSFRELKENLKSAWKLFF